MRSVKILADFNLQQCKSLQFACDWPNMEVHLIQYMYKHIDQLLTRITGQWNSMNIQLFIVMLNFKIRYQIYSICMIYSWDQAACGEYNIVPCMLVWYVYVS